MANRRCTWVLLSLLFSANACAGVYQCTDATGKKVYSDQPCDAESKPLSFKDDSFGESGRNAEVNMQGSTCRLTASGRYTTAAGYILNNTKTDRDVEITTTFTWRGNVIDLTSSTIHVVAFGRSPYSQIGGPGNIDGCEYQLRWK